MEPGYGLKDDSNLNQTPSMDLAYHWMQLMYGEERLFCCWPHNPHFTN